MFHGASSALTIPSLPLGALVGTELRPSFRRDTNHHGGPSFACDMSLLKAEEHLLFSFPCPGSLCPHQRLWQTAEKTTFRPPTLRLRGTPHLRQRPQASQPVRWLPSRAVASFVVAKSLRRGDSCGSRTARLSATTVWPFLMPLLVGGPSSSPAVSGRAGLCCGCVSVPNPQGRSPAGFLQPVKRPVCGRPIGKIPSARRTA